MLLGDFQIRLNQLLPGDAAQAHQDFRPQQRELVAQVADAGLLLLGQGVPVVGRPALDNVGDVDVGVPVQIHGGQHLVQQLAAPAHKGLPLQILVFPGAFPHEHHLGLGVAHAEHHVVARLAQGALLAGQAGFFQLVPMAYHTRFSSQLFPYCSTWAASMQIPIEISPLW